MKNYLVGSIRPSIKIWNPWAGKGDDQNQEAHLKPYQDMYKISRRSAKKFLQQPFEELFYQAPVLDARLFQIAQWYIIKELWFREPCNILVMGADTMFVKPTEIFGQFDEMRLFNYSDPKSHPLFINNFNDDIRYYPATMDPAVWDIGERHMADWWDSNEADWACGQHIHNYMFWSQKLPLSQALIPKLAWQALPYSPEVCTQFNGCPFDDAQVLHFHGSRGAGNRLELMQSLAQRFGI
jgi:hypothetical protein